MKVILITTALAFFLLPIAATARLLIVAADSTEEYFQIRDALDEAIEGDSIMVRDGNYFYETPLHVDSGMVVFAENHGDALIFCQPGSQCIFLNGNAELIGFQIIGSPLAINQYLVQIFGGPAVITNCLFEPHARWGEQLSISCNEVPPIIRQCSFYTVNGASDVARSHDSTEIWMPFNYYGRTDTLAIHSLLDPWIYISPILDSFQWLVADEPRVPKPANYHVEIFPNPFNSSTEIRYELAKQGRVKLTVYDILGREVRELVNGVLSAGEHRVVFEGIGLGSGIYLVKLQAENRSEIRKIVHLK